LNKHLVLEKIIARLVQELDGYARSARSAHLEATDEQSKAENKYDTRGLEASYLANGQIQQAAEVRRAIQEYQGMEPRVFGNAECIDTGALIEIESKGERTSYFIGPCAGGTEIQIEGRSIVVLTPSSPLGRELVGRRKGDAVKMQLRSIAERYRVVRVE
jgi:hypothetical protein